MNNVLTFSGIKVPIGTHEGKRVIIGSDHRGFEHKEYLKDFLLLRYNVIDVGTNSEERCDYPLISDKIARLVSKDRDYNTVGIGICGSGNGIAIPAGKYRYVYVARCSTPESAESSRIHNNVNFLSIAADDLGKDDGGLEKAVEIARTWLTTPFYDNPPKDETYLRRYIQTVQIERNALIDSLPWWFRPLGHLFIR